MASRLPYRNPADARRKREHDDRQRNLRRSRSAKVVTNNEAFQQVQAEAGESAEVIARGYVSVANIGDGLGTPWLALPTQPVGAAGTALTCGAYGIERATVSATFETLFAYQGYRQNPHWRLYLMARCGDAATAGELQVVDLVTGSPLREFALADWLGAVPLGTTVDTQVWPQGGLELWRVAAWGDWLNLGIQARRTAGTAPLTVMVSQSIGG